MKFLLLVGYALQFNHKKRKKERKKRREKYVIQIFFVESGRVDGYLNNFSIHLWLLQVYNFFNILSEE